MSILRSDKDPETIELAKWEMFHSQFTPGDLRPGRPYEQVRTEYPKMLYKADRDPITKKWTCSATVPDRMNYTTDNEWERARQFAERFTASCQRTVGDEDEEQRARAEFFRPTMGEAVEVAQKVQEDISTAAAERHYTDSKMSEKAQAEVKAAEAEHFGHMPELPEKPKPPKRKTARKTRAA